MIEQWPVRYDVSGDPFLAAPDRLRRLGDDPRESEHGDYLAMLSPETRKRMEADDPGKHVQARSTQAERYAAAMRQAIARKRRGR